MLFQWFSLSPLFQVSLKEEHKDAGRLFICLSGVQIRRTFREIVG
jgi:hypothetical protein